MSRLYFLTALAIGLPAQATPTYDTTKISDPALRACVEQVLPQHTLTQRVTLAVTEGSEGPRESSGSLRWKRFDNGLSKVRLQVDKSIQYAGFGLLLVERESLPPDVYAYAPALGRERRIATSALSGPLLGTDFTYEDFAFLQHVLANGQMKRLPDITLDGQAAYVLETTTDEETSAYSRIVSTVDQAWCVPTKTEFFGQNGSLAKSLVVQRADVKQIGQRWVPMRMTMENLKDKRRTLLSIDEISFEPELGDDLFTPVGLRTGH